MNREQTIELLEGEGLENIQFLNPYIREEGEYAISTSGRMAVEFEKDGQTQRRMFIFPPFRRNKQDEYVKITDLRAHFEAHEELAMARLASSALGREVDPNFGPMEYEPA